MIHAVIFDFGGVLMRTGVPLGRREWEERLGLPAGDLERAVHGSGAWVRCQRGQITPEAFWAGVADRLGVPPVDLPRLRADYFRDDALDQDLITLIRDLRKGGLRVGLLSNDSTALEAKLRDELGIYTLFNTVVISAQIKAMKPDPEAYTAILTRLGLPANETVFIDDSLANIDGAAWIGMHTLKYDAHMDVRAALRPLLPGMEL